MEILALALTAVLGTTGLVGLVNGGVNWTRRARLRHNITHAQAVNDTLNADSPEAQALSLSIQFDSLRLASLSLYPPPPVRVSVGLVIGVTALAMGVLSLVDPGMWTEDRQTTPGFAFGTSLIAIAEVLLIAAAVDWWTAKQRRDFMNRAILDRHVDVYVRRTSLDWDAIRLKASNTLRDLHPPEEAAAGEGTRLLRPPQEP